MVLPLIEICCRSHPVPRIVKLRFGVRAGCTESPKYPNGDYTRSSCCPVHRVGHSYGYGSVFSKQSTGLQTVSQVPPA